VAEYRRGTDGTIEKTDTDHDGREGKLDHEAELLKEVRASDIEPYTGLRYLSKLFRFMGVILALLLIAEVATGIYTQGSASIPTLLGEASRLIVLAGVLWGVGDLALLLIDVGHDVRAARILAARVAHAAKVAPLVPLSPVGRPALPASSSTDVAVVDKLPVRRNLADRIDNGEDGPPIP